MSPSPDFIYPRLSPTYVEVRLLQQRFNDGRYWERALDGEFLCQVDPYPKRNPAISKDEPPGTTSYIAEFFRPLTATTAEFVFKIHLYLRPDHTIGGWDRVMGREGRPDPKSLIENGVKYCMAAPKP